MCLNLVIFLMAHLQENGVDHLVGFRVGCESALSQAAALAFWSAGPPVLAQPVGPQLCDRHCSWASPTAACGNLSMGHSQSRGAIPQPHIFGCSPAEHSWPLKMAGCVNDAGGRQGGDGDLSCSLQKCPSDQGAGTACHCCTNNFPPQIQKEARKELSPEPSVPSSVFLFILTFLLSRVVS